MIKTLGLLPAILLVVTCAPAQSTSAQFEAASVKVSAPSKGPFVRTMSTGGPGTVDPGLYRCENCSLTMLLTKAFALPDYQLVAPAWAESARFDVDARVNPSATPEEFRAMQQNLLRERFGVRFHREPKELSVFDLILINGPAKLNAAPAPGSANPEGFPILPPRGGPLMMVLRDGHAAMRSDSESMSEFAGRLSPLVHRPVFDGTGLSGKYSFTLRWVIEEPGYTTDDPGGLSIFRALQDQLGLRLAAAKGTLEMFVVDAVKRVPSAN